MLIKQEVIDGVRVNTWEKVCPYCHKKFITTSRTQKYCSDSCCKKYQKKQKNKRERYSRIKEIERLRVRAHSLAVSIMDQLDDMNILPKKCAVCGCIEGLELHHKNLNFFDNTPSNLVWLCRKHHSEAHSLLEKDLNEKGILLSEYYEKSMEPFMRVLNKNSE